MKVVGALRGIAGYLEAQEEYSPERPPPLQDIINLVQGAFAFTNYPVLQPTLQPEQVLTFANGRFIDDEGDVFAINQLVMAQNGDLVATASTSDSEKVLERLVSLLDERARFRLATAKKSNIYHSTIVVEFDGSISKHMSTLNKIVNIVNEFRHKRR